MAIPFVAFWVLLLWGLYDGDIYPRDGAVFVGTWLALLLGFVVFRLEPVLFVVPTVVLDIVLILKVFGTDIRIR